MTEYINVEEKECINCKEVRPLSKFPTIVRNKGIPIKGHTSGIKISSLVIEKSNPLFFALCLAPYKM